VSQEATVDPDCARRIATVRDGMEAFSRGDDSGVVAMVSPHVVWRSNPDWPGGGEAFEGHDGILRWSREFLGEAFREMQLEALDAECIRDCVVMKVRLRFRGRSSEIGVGAVSWEVMRFEGETVAERWSVSDRETALALARGER
jgi:hypothetical protein